MKMFAMVALSVATALSGVAPAAAAMPAPARIETTSQATAPVQEVQYRREHRRHFHRHYPRGYRHHGGYYRHHGGYRHHRRHRSGIPLGAFAAGAIIGGALGAPRAHAGNAHVNWCYSRYRSYRAFDNTFQPYHGPRRACYSPYR
jgi:predicted GNAT superfamily acetyltransferase